MFIFILSCLLAVVVSFMCSLAEAVLLSLNPIRLETLRGQGKSYALLWQNMRQNIGRPIAAILILNTVAHTGGATIAGGAFNKIFGDEWLWLFSVLFTLTILLGTEILPKVIGVTYNDLWAPWIAPVLKSAIVILKPLILLCESFSNMFKDRRAPIPKASIDDIRTLAQIAKTEKLIEAEQESIILKAARLRDTTVESIMIPLEWIIYLKVHLPFPANFEIARNHLHTRYPISADDSADGIMGYVNFKEMASQATNLIPSDISPFIRPVLFVSSQTNLNTMLKLMIARHHHLAIVKDPRGKIVGMVTVEDLIEEIVGDIEDEFDLDLSHMIQITEQSWRVGAGIPMNTIIQKFPLTVEAADISKPIGLWLEAQMQGALYPGVSVTQGTLKFSIQQVRRGKIHQVIIENMAAPG